MKKIFLFALLLSLALALLAEGPKEEAIQSLDAAKALLNSGDLVKAQDEINFAMGKINEIQAEELLKYIPEAPAGFKLEEKSSQGMGSAGSFVGSAIATATYSKDDTNIDLSITLGGVMGQAGSMMGLANMFGGMASAGKTVRVGSYTGNQEYDKDEGSGTLTIQVGSKITVLVDGDDIESAEILKTFAEKINLAGLEKSF